MQEDWLTRTYARLFPTPAYPRVWSTSEEGRTLTREVLELKRFGGGFQALGWVYSAIVLLFVSKPAALLIALPGIAVVLGVASYRRQELHARLKRIRDLVHEESLVLEEHARAHVPLDSAGDPENLAELEAQSAFHYTGNWEWVRKKLLRRDEYECAICGKTIVLATSVAHHITPFSLGGRTRFGNLASICTTCHARLHPWLDDGLNCYWIRRQRGQVWCWRCKKRIDNKRKEIRICSDCGWLYHLPDHACGCNWPGRASSAWGARPN